MITIAIGSMIIMWVTWSLAYIDPELNMFWIWLGTVTIYIIAATAKDVWKTIRNLNL